MISPKYIAEDGSEQYEELNDYKLQCFNGKVDNILVCVGRHSSKGVRYHYFDKEWNYLPYCPYDDTDYSILPSLRPISLNEMIVIAEKLSSGFPEMRVDLYCIKGKVYFGELTLFSQSGFDDAITEEADQILGKKLQLPQKV
jgi:hypothetical protein